MMVCFSAMSCMVSLAVLNIACSESDTFQKRHADILRMQRILADELKEIEEVVEFERLLNDEVEFAYEETYPPAGFVAMAQAMPLSFIPHMTGSYAHGTHYAGSLMPYPIPTRMGGVASYVAGRLLAYPDGTVITKSPVVHWAQATTSDLDTFTVDTEENVLMDSVLVTPTDNYSVVLKELTVVNTTPTTDLEVVSTAAEALNSDAITRHVVVSTDTSDEDSIVKDKPALDDTTTAPTREDQRRQAEHILVNNTLSYTASENVSATNTVNGSSNDNNKLEQRRRTKANLRRLEQLRRSQSKIDPPQSQTQVEPIDTESYQQQGQQQATIVSSSIVIWFLVAIVIGSGIGYVYPQDTAVITTSRRQSTTLFGPMSHDSACSTMLPVTMSIMKSYNTKFQNCGRTGRRCSTTDFLPI